MCRLLAYVSPTPKTPLEVFGAAQLERFAALSALHCHGWGAAWVDKSGDPVHRHRDLRSANRDPEFDRLAGHQPAVAMGLHLRWAVDHATVTEANNHPFLQNGIALMHNGTISPRSRLDALLDAAVGTTMTSSTDSERYLALIAERRPDLPDLAGAVAATVAQLRPAFPEASLNAVLLEGTELVVVQASTGAVIPVEDLRARSGPDGLPIGHDAGYFQMRWRTEPDGTVLIASSGLDTEGWTTLPADSITAADLATGVITQSRPLLGSAV